MDGNACLMEDGIYTIDTRNKKFHYVRVPAGLPGIKAGTKLNVLKTIITDEHCPLGSGLLCLDIEWGIKAVFTGSKVIAWLRDINNKISNC